MELKLIQLSEKVPDLCEQCCVYNHDMRTWFFANICQVGNTLYWEGNEIFQETNSNDIYIVLPSF